MKILVTGSNGFLGHGIVELLSKSDNKIIASCRNVFDYDANNIIVKAGDIFSIENPYLYFDQPDIVVHCAWRDGFKHASENHINDLPKHYAFFKKYD